LLLSGPGGTAWGLGLAATLAAVALGAILIVPSLLTTPGQTPSPEPSIVATSSVTGEPSASPLPTATELPTMSPEPTATVEPTARPTARPTLNWADKGFTASVKSPVAIGSKAKVTLKGPVGPTCTLSITYPSGSAANLPNPTHPSAGSWQWTWTVPSKAQTGFATGTATCTYAGVPKSGPVQFKVTNPALPGGWDIQVAMPASRSSGDSSVLSVHVTVQGTMPVDPSYASQIVVCNLDLRHGSYVSNVWTPDMYLDPPITSFTADFDIGALGPDFIGTDDWVVKCRNLTANSAFQSDSGSIVIN
jgi:hypothetical protein